MSFSSIKEQLEFACEKCSDFAPTKYPNERALFTFSAINLIEYLKENQEISQTFIIQSDDKRYQPSTILFQAKDVFIVGQFEFKREREFEQAQIFTNLVEATADYILLNWQLPRLHPKQTEHKLKRQWGDHVLFILDEDGKEVASIQLMV